MRQFTPFTPGARVGLTTTIPVEVVLAAGLTPVDLNNLFIADPLALALVSQAEAAGFPRTICTWIKGIYATLQHHPEIRTVIAACQAAGGVECTSDEVTNDNLCIVSVASSSTGVVAGGAGPTIEAARQDALNKAIANGTPEGDDAVVLVSACP